MPSTPQSQPVPLLKRRGTMLAVCSVIVVAVGAYAGAQLKTNVEQQREVQKRREETVEEKIQRLESYKAGLVIQKQKLEGKIAELRAKSD